MWVLTNEGEPGAVIDNGLSVIGVFSAPEKAFDYATAMRRDGNVSGIAWEQHNPDFYEGTEENGRVFLLTRWDVDPPHYGPHHQL